MYRGPERPVGLRCPHCRARRPLSFLEVDDVDGGRIWQALCASCATLYHEDVNTAYPLQCDRCRRNVPLSALGHARLCTDCLDNLAPPPASLLQ